MALGEVRFSEVMADAVLNHRQATLSSVLGVYQQSERKAAMEAWAKILTNGDRGKEGGG